MAKLEATINSYDDAHAFLAERGVLSRKLGNNTYVTRSWQAEKITVRLHATDIVTYYPDGSIGLDTGGWNTPTTRDRMSQLIPAGFTVGTRKGQAELRDHRTDTVHPFNARVAIMNAITYHGEIVTDIPEV